VTEFPCHMLIWSIYEQQRPVHIGLRNSITVFATIFASLPASATAGADGDRQFWTLISGTAQTRYDCGP
jgi:hypothetical protein